MSLEDEEKFITVILSDGSSRRVSHRVLMMSKMMEAAMSNETPEEFKLDQYDSRFMNRVLNYMEYHLDNPGPVLPKPLPHNRYLDDVLCAEDKAMFNDFDTHDLYQFVRVCNFMHCKPLLELACAKVASLLIGKTKNEIQEFLIIERQ